MWSPFTKENDPAWISVKRSKASDPPVLSILIKPRKPHQPKLHFNHLVTANGWFGIDSKPPVTTSDILLCCSVGADVNLLPSDAGGGDFWTKKGSFASIVASGQGTKTSTGGAGPSRTPPAAGGDSARGGHVPPPNEYDPHNLAPSYPPHFFMLVQTNIKTHRLPLGRNCTDIREIIAWSLHGVWIKFVIDNPVLEPARTTITPDQAKFSLWNEPVLLTNLESQWRSINNRKIRKPYAFWAHEYNFHAGYLSFITYMKINSKLQRLYNATRLIEDIVADLENGRGSPNARDPIVLTRQHHYGADWIEIELLTLHTELEARLEAAPIIRTWYDENLSLHFFHDLRIIFDLKFDKPRNPQNYQQTLGIGSIFRGFPPGFRVLF